MKVVTAAEMKNIDKLAAERFSIPGIVLMDQAAKAIADVVFEHLRNTSGSDKRVAVFCGKGNNGGDGFGAARFLLNYGVKVSVYLVNATLDKINGDAALEAAMLQKAGVEIIPILTEEECRLAIVKARRSDIIIDAMLGTGFSGELQGITKLVCSMINNLQKPIAAVDIPTGVNADFGTVSESAVKADFTITMALPKSGLLLYPGKEHVGKLFVADIGMSQKLLDASDSGMHLLEAKEVASLLPIRKKNAHKGDAGRVVIAAGSPGFTGAAAMSSWGAIKGGAGLVSLLTPLTSRDILSTKLTEVMVHGLLERMPGVLGGAAEGDILQKAESADVLAIGPGFGTSENTTQVIRNVLKKVKTPVVIDADAITALKGNMEILPQMHAPKVLTPHPGEMARITGIDIGVIDRERINVAAHYAKEWKATVVLKGAPTVVAFPDGTSYINSTGCCAMATGGSGDVLTGLLAALIASGMEVPKAALAAVYLHGLAGEIASDGEVGLAASEIANSLPRARKILFDNHDLQLNVYNSAIKVVK